MAAYPLARKRFGQHFLVDPGAVRRIVEAVDPKPGERLVEIGPGLAALTRPLIERAGHLHAIEIDRDIAARLLREFDPAALTLHCEDALRFDFSRLGQGLRIVGNLPYNISTPLLFHLARFAGSIADLHVMLQKEVVERMAAAPSTPQYGRLSVMLQYRFEMRRLFDIAPGAFRPVPRVTSAFVRMRPYPELPFPAQDEPLFARIVAAAFSQRRKVLSNALKGLLPGRELAQLGIDPGARGESLSVAEFVRLANRALEMAQGKPGD